MRTGTARVLVVEDDPDLAALEAEVLKLRGHEVDVASNGREALEAVDRARPDLILLDMKMPVMNGREFADEYRRREPSTAPIVVVTAADDAQRRAAEVGASGWIAKPFDPDALVDQVARLLMDPSDPDVNPRG
ncbi:MAG TPA: response regulator [Myxococcales bacterium]|nr:response regulator [Myxococcales bacterium]